MPRGWLKSLLSEFLTLEFLLKCFTFYTPIIKTLYRKCDVWLTIIRTAVLHWSACIVLCICCTVVSYGLLASPSILCAYVKVAIPWNYPYVTGDDISTRSRINHSVKWVFLSMKYRHKTRATGRRLENTAESIVFIALKISCLVRYSCVIYTQCLVLGVTSQAALTYSDDYWLGIFPVNQMYVFFFHLSFVLEIFSSNLRNESIYSNVCVLYKFIIIVDITVLE